MNKNSSIVKGLTVAVTTLITWVFGAMVYIALSPLYLFLGALYYSKSSSIPILEYSLAILFAVCLALSGRLIAVSLSSFNNKLIISLNAVLHRDSLATWAKYFLGMLLFEVSLMGLLIIIFPKILTLIMG